MFQNTGITGILKRILTIKTISTNFCLINQIYLALVCNFFLFYREKYDCNAFTGYNLQANQIIRQSV